MVYSYTSFRFPPISCIVHLIYSTAVVHLPDIHELLTTAGGNLLRVHLVGEGLVHGLDRVHRVLRSGHASREVVDTGGTAHLEETVGNAETEACKSDCQ